MLFFSSKPERAGKLYWEEDANGLLTVLLTVSSSFLNSARLSDDYYVWDASK